MPALEAVLPATDPWPRRRDRAEQLAERYPHAALMLELYAALISPQSAAFHAAREYSLPLVGGPAGPREPRGSAMRAFEASRGEGVIDFILAHAMPGIIDATVAHGPVLLRDGVVALFATADLHMMIRRWLSGDPLSPIETYLARASASPVLEAMTISEPKTGGGATCPHCGGLPQLSYFSYTGEALLSGPRYLVCSRCNWNWTFSRMSCAACGESTGSKLPIYQEGERFPHARVDGCSTCHHYLLTFDLRREPQAVPLVDEIAALPLDLYARDRGLTKITPNLMGN